MEHLRSSFAKLCAKSQLVNYHPLNYFLCIYHFVSANKPASHLGWPSLLVATTSHGNASHPCRGASYVASNNIIDMGPRMICARIVNGFGTGILNAIVPVWATETAQHTSRGRFISIQFSMNIFGIFAAYWMEYGLSFYRGGVTALRWRFPIAFQMIPLLGLFGAVWLFPESPRWLVKVGREEEARYVLKRLRGDGTDYADQDKAEEEFQDIHNVAELEKNTLQSSSYFCMLTGRGSGTLHTGRRVCLVVWLQIMQKWVGITAVVICELNYPIEPTCCL